MHRKRDQKIKMDAAEECIDDKTFRRADWRLGRRWGTPVTMTETAKDKCLNCLKLQRQQFVTVTNGKTVGLVECMASGRHHLSVLFLHLTISLLHTTNCLKEGIGQRVQIEEYSWNDENEKVGCYPNKFHIHHSDYSTQVWSSPLCWTTWWLTHCHCLSSPTGHIILST